MINIKLILAIVLSILATYAIYKIRKITNKFSFIIPMEIYCENILMLKVKLFFIYAWFPGRLDQNLFLIKHIHLFK